MLCNKKLSNALSFSWSRNQGRSDSAKSSYFRAFTAIHSKVWGTASEVTVLASLLHSKCLPVLLYATEACPLLVRDRRPLELTFTRVSLFMKIFGTGSSTVITKCRWNFSLLSMQQPTIRSAHSYIPTNLCSIWKSNLRIVRSYCNESTKYYIIIFFSYTSTRQPINVFYDQLY